MNDDFLTRMRKQPREVFAADLYRKLDESATVPRRLLPRWVPALAGAGLLLALVAVFTLTPAQALAQDFLNLFRVKRFTAITIDPARLEQIGNTKVDFESLFARDLVVMQAPGEPQAVSLDDLRGVSSVRVRFPERVPQGYAFGGASVQSEGSVRMTADAEKLQSLLDALRITDVRVPGHLQGAVITVRKPPTIVMNYRQRSETLSFIQSRSPEATLPDGVSLSELGQIGLRVIGLSASEARQYAQSIDWSATLVVPVPANAGSFRQVSVGGQNGLLISSSSSGRTSDSGRQRQLLLWSDGEMVFAVEGAIAAGDLLDFAGTIR